MENIVENTVWTPNGDAVIGQEAFAHPAPPPTPAPAQPAAAIAELTR